MEKPFRTTFTERDYARVRQLDHGAGAV